MGKGAPPRLQIRGIARAHYVDGEHFGMAGW